jgi:polyferredoxin
MKNEQVKLKATPRGWRKIWNIQLLRYLSLLGFFIFIAVIFYLKSKNGEGPLYASPEAFCPLGGFETLYFTLTTGGIFIQHTHLSNMVLFLALLLSVVAVGPFFCGWICPLGAIQQAVTGLRRWLQKRIHILNSFGRWMSLKTRPLVFLDRYLRFAKYLVLIWILWGTITAGVMVFRNVDPWAGILNILELGVTIGFWVFIGTVIAAIIGDRVWCRYLCPLGAINGLVGKIGLIRVQRESDACTGCKLCTKKCPMHIEVHKKSRVISAECNMCLKCLDVCPAKGALDLKLNLPIIKKTGISAAEKIGNE